MKYRPSVNFSSRNRLGPFWSLAWLSPPFNLFAMIFQEKLVSIRLSAIDDCCKRGALINRDVAVGFFSSIRYLWCSRYIPSLPEVSSGFRCNVPSSLIDCLSRKLRFRFGLGSIMRTSLRKRVRIKQECSYLKRETVLHLFFSLFRG